MVLTWLSKYRDFGLLLLRIGLGVMMIMHGWPKLIGGPDVWTRLGGAMANFGITFTPEIWGLAAALAELLGGVLLILGFAMRPACIALAGTMAVAMMFHINKGDPFTDWSHAAELLIVFVSLLFIGAGKFSLDRD